MILLSLASRNIWRNPRRTILSVAAIAFAVMVLEFFFSLQLKSYDAAISASTGVFHGHIQIQREGYLENSELRNYIPDSDLVLDAIAKIPGVLASSKRSLGFGLLSSADRSFGAQIIGVLPDRELGVSSIPGVIKSGRYLNSEDTYNCVIGRTLAENLKVGLDHDLSLMSQSVDGGIVATSFKVVGIFESGSIDIDRAFIEIPNSVFEVEFGMHSGAHNIVIRARSIDDVLDLEAQIHKQLLQNKVGTNLTIVNWKKLLPGLQESIQLDMAAGWLFYCSLIVIVSFTILNTFLMSVLERTREFSTVLALGASPSFLAILIALEGILLSIIGIIIGNILGALLVEYFRNVGFTAPGAEEVLKKWNLPGRVYPVITFQSFIWPTITVGLSSIISVVYPMMRVFKIQPVKGLAGEV
ncbi:MAG: FtsX-like permease family protein [bacterium]|nr:FtsX-like permease family protein [bacterium]